MRPSRYLFALAAIFIVLFAVVLGTGSGSLKDRLAPRLAIDLAGGTSMVLQARTPDGGAPTEDRLAEAQRIIERRVNARGVSEAEVYVQGNDKIVVSVPGQSDDSLREVGQTSEMRFRKVLGTILDTSGVTPAPTASADPSASPGTSPEVTGSPDPTASASPEPSPSTAAAPTASAGPTPSASNSGLPDLEDVQAKLGDAYTAAANIDLAAVAQAGQSATTVSGDAELMALLEPFRELTAAEVAVLPYNIQYVVPQIGCSILGARPVGSIVDPAVRAVACEDTGGYKYLLDVADVEGRDLADAVANLNTQSGLGGWQVDLTFTSSGADKWQALTSEAFNNTGDAWSSGPGPTGVPVNPNCATTQLSDDGSRNACLVAAVLDNEIVTAPVINAVLSTQSTITGEFNRTTAQDLATQLKYGALPVSFEIASLNTVTATLGNDYLRAGLLAAGIGMALVVIYAFFYYRLLGSVIVLSLVLSALLTFGMLVALGRGIGFTLSLAGIAGFIVSLGVAADSFVIYFERLKDEIREGRTPRAAVNRAWARARRTIITANAVTIMAAVVLYLVGSSAVQGFAFALGLATLLDLVIVFLFRHPMMTMLARTPAFLSPRVSGLGRVLGHAKAEDGSTAGRSRTKEA
jgi:preprotein translocase subunit SecD